MQRVENELSSLPPAAPSANMAKVADGMMCEHYWTHDKIEMLREDLAIPEPVCLSLTDSVLRLSLIHI